MGWAAVLVTCQVVSQHSTALTSCSYCLLAKALQSQQLRLSLRQVLVGWSLNCHCFLPPGLLQKLWTYFDRFDRENSYIWKFWTLRLENFIVHTVLFALYARRDFCGLVLLNGCSQMLVTFFLFHILLEAHGDIFRIGRITLVSFHAADSGILPASRDVFALVQQVVNLWFFRRKKCHAQERVQRNDQIRQKHVQMDLGFGFICCHSSQYKDDAQIWLCTCGFVWREPLWIQVVCTWHEEA